VLRLSMGLRGVVGAAEPTGPPDRPNAGGPKSPTSRTRPPAAARSPLMSAAPTSFKGDTDPRGSTTVDETLRAMGPRPTTAARTSALRRVARDAEHDALTDLLNRRGLESSITQRAHSCDALFTLMFVDLDRFKWVNDHKGHHIGDETLCAIGSRLTSVVRDND